MKSKIKHIKGQLALEYTMFICVVVAALMAMVLYVRFIVQGKYRESADVFGQGRQYAPGITQTTTTIVNVR